MATKNKNKHRSTNSLKLFGVAIPIRGKRKEYHKQSTVDIQPADDEEYNVCIPPKILIRENGRLGVKSTISCYDIEKDFLQSVEEQSENSSFEESFDESSDEELSDEKSIYDQINDIIIPNRIIEVPYIIHINLINIKDNNLIKINVNEMDTIKPMLENNWKIVSLAYNNGNDIIVKDDINLDLLIESIKSGGNVSI
jgi:hypothetical protein